MNNKLKKLILLFVVFTFMISNITIYAWDPDKSSSDDDGGYIGPSDPPSDPYIPPDNPKPYKPQPQPNPGNENEKPTKPVKPEKKEDDKYKNKPNPPQKFEDIVDGLTKTKNLPINQTSLLSNFALLIFYLYLLNFLLTK